MSLSEENSEKLLGYKRRKKESNEKEVFLYDSYGKNEVLSEKKSFKKINEFDDYLNTLKNPYFILNGIINDLNNFENRRFFFYSEDVSKIYQKEDDSEILNDYKKYLYDYLDIDSKPIKINYPMTLDKLLLGPTFFFDLFISNIYINIRRFNIKKTVKYKFFKFVFKFCFIIIIIQNNSIQFSKIKIYKAFIFPLHLLH